MSDPFAGTSIEPGHGCIYLALLPPATPRLRTASYQYPLKLVSPAPIRATSASPSVVHTVYLLTYGGGIVAGDTINLQVTLEPSTRLILLTQGSTKIFKSPDRSLLSKQSMTTHLAPGSALCYLPDPVQPFERSNFEQQQIYHLSPSADSHAQALGSLCVLDWVSNGRPANGEDWSFFRYGSKNEVFIDQASPPTSIQLPSRPGHPSSTSSQATSPTDSRLLLRDNLLLDDQGVQGSVTARMNRLGVYANLILCGPLFQKLGQFFMDEFRALPQIGGRKWDSASDDGKEETIDPAAARRAVRQRQETIDGVLWSAAAVRGCVVVKFAAREVEGGKRWLLAMLQDEATVVHEFGERALMCLR